MLKGTKSLTLLLAMSSLCAYADDSSSGGDGLQIEIAAYEVAQVPAEPMSCKEARETAWFERELARTDGDTNPELKYIPCDSENEMVAQSKADAN